jgi:hypothetical protein
MYRRNLQTLICISLKLQDYIHYNIYIYIYHPLAFIAIIFVLIISLEVIA